MLALLGRDHFVAKALKYFKSRTQNADEDAKYLKETLNELIPDANVEVTDAGCVISSHCGKGTIGILYILK